MLVVIEFEGGFRDGEVISNNPEDTSGEFSEVDSILAMTGNGTVGRAYMSASDYARQELKRLADEGKSGEEIHDNLKERGIFMNQYYTVVDRQEKNGEVYLKLRSTPPPSN